MWSFGKRFLKCDLRWFTSTGNINHFLLPAEILLYLQRTESSAFSLRWQWGAVIARTFQSLSGTSVGSSHTLPPALPFCGPSRHQGNFLTLQWDKLRGRRQDGSSQLRWRGTSWIDPIWEKSSGWFNSFNFLSLICSRQKGKVGKWLSLCHWISALVSGHEFSKDLSMDLQLSIWILHFLSIAGKVIPYQVFIKTPIQTSVL